MKILFIAPNYLPHIGGVEKHIQAVSKELIRDNHQVSILVQKYDNSYADHEAYGGLEVVRLHRYPNKYLNKLRNILYLVKHFRYALQYDIIHFHDVATFYSFGIVVFPLLKLFRKKVFITFHGWEGDVPPKKRVVLQRKAVEICVDGNMCIGHYIEKWYGTKADIVSYGGVAKKDATETNEKYILFVGRLEYDTGIWHYLKAWEEIHRHIDIPLILCGDGSLKEEIKKYIQVNNIRNVILQGFVTNIDEYIKDAKVVFTSGYLGILEAFSYKKNVIAVYDHALKKDYLMSIPHYQDIMWVVEGRADRIAEALSQALVDTTKKNAAFHFAQRHSWESVKREYDRLWNVSRSV